MKPQPVSLELHEVSRTFGGLVALHPTDLSIKAGEFASLLGPSGCGKTTTLRLIAGFDMPNTGSIHIGGRDLTRVPPDRRKLGMVFQNYALFPHMTVAANIGFGLRMAGLGRGEIEARVKRMLDLIHLPQYGDRYPSQLSGGQQQRVAVARSLVTEPSVLLLDEPMAALDKNLRQSMQAELRQIQQNFGITTILVTHDQEEALTMSDTIVVMHGGRVIQTGSPEEVYNRPRTRFVSEFLGASNLIEAKVAGTASGEGGLRLAIQLVDGRAVETVAEGRASAGDGVLLSVRPEDVSMHRDAPASLPESVVLPGTISRHVFRGASHSYEVSVEGGHELLIYEQAGGASADAVWKVGEAVWVSWCTQRQSAFRDAGSDRALA